ncbi:hypothetical protein KEU06_01190 [Pseudaminobacter sp. 19-2017]|uniref:Uncharacterized protein n=1 Tax=Pseudaminobacter soli (ex Zhang et al. 2022) TaxID=2831468 RepID=A0A942I6E9_9HYPH|nr:hypothetical protein [Pseudaminobacter soli]MBS3647240.1 hypothetical protein [Pseudaminobacter soli]
MLPYPWACAAVTPANPKVAMNNEATVVVSKRLISVSFTLRLIGAHSA